MLIQIETPRILLRQFQEEDAQNMFELNNDWDVLKYTGDKPFDTVNEALEFIKCYDQYQKYGMGRLSILSKESGEYLGWCGLKYQPEKNEVDLGYRLHKRHWGKGYATESALVSLAYGFEQLNLDEIFARAMKENLASIRVFEKIGMTYHHDDTCHEEAAVVYAMNNKEWNTLK